MNRREFVTASVGATVGVRGAAEAEAGGRPDGGQEFYELRIVHLRRGPNVKAADDYFRGAFIPAMKRHGIGPVGVFSVTVGPDSPALYVLIPHKSLDSIVDVAAKMAADDEYHTAGAEWLNRPATNPGYVRIESSLLMAFSSIPRLQVPDIGKPRLFELRTYESHSKKAGRKKIEMFNTGEIAIFRKNGLQPVFFGETLIGPRLPNLTYMLVHADMAARDKNFGAFVADPDWKELSGKPEYMDSEIVSNITNLFLRPTAYSQI